MAREIVKIKDLGSRPAEAGRIRLGVKAKTQRGKERPASIDTLRFTSPYRDCIEAIADQFGGTARPWNEPTTRIQNQWEVTTTTSEVPVLLPVDPLDQGYELWSSGSGRQRRCDGETCMVPQKQGDSDYDYVQRPCLCMAEGVRSCSPKTRLNVVLPTIPFRGVWRAETGSWTALEELPYQVEMLEALQSTGRLIQARLALHKESKRTPVGTRNYVVIRLSMDATPLELIAGAGGAAELAQAHVAAVEAPRRAALPAAANTAPDPVRCDGNHGGPSCADPQCWNNEPPRPGTTDDDIIDAEIVEEPDDGPLLAGLRADAEQFGLDPDRFVAAALRSVDCTDGKLTEQARHKLTASRQMMAAGTIEPTGFTDEGGVAWTRT